MSLSQQIFEVLPHKELSDFLAEQTTAINQAFAQERSAHQPRASLAHGTV